ARCDSPAGCYELVLLTWWLPETAAFARRQVSCRAVDRPAASDRRGIRRSRTSENPVRHAQAKMSRAACPAPEGDEPQDNPYIPSLGDSIRLYNGSFCMPTQDGVLCAYSSTCVNRPAAQATRFVKNLRK